MLYSVGDSLPSDTATTRAARPRDTGRAGRLATRWIGNLRLRCTRRETLQPGEIILQHRVGVQAATIGRVSHQYTLNVLNSLILYFHEQDSSPSVDWSMAMLRRHPWRERLATGGLTAALHGHSTPGRFILQHLQRRKSHDTFLKCFIPIHTARE